MNVSNNATLHHTSILVKDLEKSAENFAKALSVTWNLWTIEPDKCFVNGKASPFSFRVALTQVGDASLELITPNSGESVYDEQLATKGEGFHHTCFAYPDLESMQAAKNEMLAQGFSLIQHGYTEGAFEFCYFELKEPNVLLELLYLKELPPPEKTIG